MSDEIENIDTLFQQVVTPNAEMEILELEKEKTKIAEKFLSEGVTQKTEISKNERMLLPILYSIATDPFTISKKVCKKLENYEIQSLHTFLDLYFKLGIPLNRKGRKEEVEVLRSLLGQNNIEVEKGGSLREKLLK